jgi:DNA-binding CsgD family transcriptional regulator
VSSEDRRNDTRRIPFGALRTVLGRDEGAEYERRWDCGCTAIIRDGVHHTARWRPCETHARKPAESSESRAAAQVRRREAPRFFIVNAHLRVLSIAPGAELGALIPQALVRLSATGAHREASLIPLNDDIWLRTMPLDLATDDATMVFVESGERGSIQRAASRYGLSKREMDVLRLVLEHRSNADIACALFIAESTVGDHIKSIYRKTSSSRRAELVGKLLAGND